jgi:hypothetical protein
MLNRNQDYFSFLKKVPETGKLANCFFVFLGITILLGGCRTPPEPVQISPSPSVSPPIKTAEKSPQKTAQKPKNSTSKKPASNLVSLGIFKLDNQCNQFIAEKVSVSKTKMLEEAVARTIDRATNADFDLSGYRINRKGETVTIDFRVAPDAKRQLKALSNCEQLALYGGLRKTLTGNSVLKVKSVQFSDRGQLIKP